MLTRLENPTAADQTQLFEQGKQELLLAKTWAEKKKALSKLLFTDSGNEDDCLVMSLLFASRLISGEHILKTSFPQGMALLSNNEELVWTDDFEKYRHSHPLFRSSMETDLPVAITKQTGPISLTKTYLPFEPTQKLGRDGSLILLLNSGPDSHAVTLLKLGEDIFCLDSSMEPGAWIKTYQEYLDEKAPILKEEGLSQLPFWLSFRYALLPATSNSLLPK
jgi:hypothetical protein